MTAMKEQIARHTSAQTTQQQLPDDPLAPKPIRFTHQRGADGVLPKRTVNGPTAGWHLEDGSEGEDVDPSTPPRGQASTPSRQTRDYQQQARVTQAYPPDYEDADEPDTRPPRSAMRYQDTLPHQYRGQTVLPTPPQRLRRQRLTGQAPGSPQRAPRRRNRHWSVYLVTGMATMTTLVIGLSSLGSWWQHVQDDWTYGMPRTYQTDAVVGHNHDSRAHPSHFLALNLRGQVEVFELPAGDPTKVRVFLGPNDFREWRRPGGGDHQLCRSRP